MDKYYYILVIGFLFLLPQAFTWASPQTAPGRITIISPNGGESWELGSSHNIQWEAMRISGNVRISLWQNGSIVGNIATNVSPDVASILWTVGDIIGGTAAAGTGYSIKIKEIGTFINDVSNAPFQISPAPDPQLIVTSPNGGENWTIGESNNITWNASGLSANLKITLWHNGLFVGVIAYDIGAESGMYPWAAGQYLGGMASPGTGYIVKIKGIGITTSDVSDASFELSAVIPQITVTSPNGGENWTIGESNNITWNASGLSANLKITLWQNSTPIGIIAHEISPLSGFFPWTVGDHNGGTAAPGTGYAVKIKEIGTAVSDISDGSFEILPTPGPSITVTSPNGGEIWELGTNNIITWNATSLSEDLKISLWKDGSQVGVIATDINPDSGALGWTVGEYFGGVAGPGSGYNVRIKEIGTSILDNSDSPFEITPTPNTWTIMVYLDADNNLESAAIDDFLEMASVGSSQNVNIIVQFDRIPGYDTSYDNWTSTKRYYITKGLTPTSGNALQDLEEANMGDPATLTDFINWAKTNYPATNYALILWDHGDGWRQPRERITFKTVCWDDTSQDQLYMSEVKTAINSAGGAGLIGFDACLMGMVEVAYEIRNLGNIMVASEEIVPFDGWPYDIILGDLVLHPYWANTQLGANIVDSYYASYGNSYTQSAIYLSSMDTLATTIDNFSQALLNYWDSSPARVKAAAASVKTAIENSILNEKNGLAWPGAHGLAIYFPSNLLSFDPDYNGTIIDFPNDVLWDEFLSQFYLLMGGSWIDTARGLSQQFYYPSHIDLYHFCEILQTL